MRSKTPLALMEQVIMVLVFALAAALCLRAFVYADTVSRDCEERDRAVMAAQTTAEALKLCRGDFAKAERMAEAALEDVDIVFAGSDYELRSGFAIAVTPAESGIEGLGCAEITALGANGETILTLTVAWQEVSGNG